mgnify:CR=1 FL=1
MGKLIHLVKSLVSIMKVGFLTVLLGGLHSLLNDEKSAGLGSLLLEIYCEEELEVTSESYLLRPKLCRWTRGEIYKRFGSVKKPGLYFSPLENSIRGD